MGSFFRHVSVTISTIALALLLTTLSAFAEDIFVWEDYNIGFSVASEMVVTENNADSFSAVSRDEEISISISPWLDESVDEDSLADATLHMAVDLYLFDDSEVDGDYFEVDTFNGFYLIAATGALDAPDFMIVALMLDTESETNIAIAIGFSEGNEEEAVDILNSFVSY